MPARTPSSTAAQEAADQALWRRRVIIELRIDEVPLLAAAQARHGTKRAAIVAALHAETRIGEVEATLDRLQAEHAAQAAKDAAKTAAEITRLAKEKDAAKTAATKASKAAASLKQAATRAGESADAEIARLEDAVRELQLQLDRAESRSIDWAYCARCDAWVKRSRWAWAEGDKGEYAYHDDCGDHGPGVLDASSRLVWRPI